MRQEVIILGPNQTGSVLLSPVPPAQGILAQEPHLGSSLSPGNAGSKPELAVTFPLLPQVSLLVGGARGLTSAAPPRQLCTPIEVKLFQYSEEIES